MLQNNFDEALAEYLKVIFKYPDSQHQIIEARLCAAELFEKKQQWEKAKKMYEKLLEQDSPYKQKVIERLKDIKRKSE
jgi:tetratricopeptide (TPR) repeat protein